MNPNYQKINAAEQMARGTSVWNFYRQLIEFRKRYSVFADGRFTLLCRENPQIFAYTRESETDRLLVVCNFFGESLEWPAECLEVRLGAGEQSGMELLLSNYSDNEKERSPEILRPYEAGMYYSQK